jgi:hypothetical protein
MDTNFRFCRFIRLMAPVALLLPVGGLIAPLVAADFPGSRSGNCPNCPVNSRFFGYYPTLWRRWPGTEPQPQPALPQPPETTKIPPVEPPPPTDEIKNENKPMGTESPGTTSPGTTTPMTQPPPNSGAGARMNEPSAKRPAGSLPDEDASPAPLENPGKLNQLPGPASSPVNSSIEPRRNQQLPWGSQGAAWPPANILRHDEIRASAQLPDRTPHPDASAATNSTRLASQDGVVATDFHSTQSIDRMAGVNVDRLDKTLQSHAPLPAAADAKDDPVAGASLDALDKAHRRLHWIAPPKAKSAPPQPFETETNVAPRCDKCALNGSADLSASRRVEACQAPATARLPFVPSNSLCHALPPIDPQAPEIRGDSHGAMPAEAANVRLAPPNKVTEISVPMFAGGPAKDRLPPPDALSHSNVTKIDPLAIGKTLDLPMSTMTNVVQSSVRLNGEAHFTEMVNPPSAPQGQPPFGARLSAHAEPITTAKPIAPEAADGRKPVTGPLTPASANIATPASLTTIAAVSGNTSKETPKPPFPATVDANSHCSPAATRILSDDRNLPRDRVEQTAFYGAAPPQKPIGQPNPLRNATATTGEAISTDGPTGRFNPLR